MDKNTLWKEIKKLFDSSNFDAQKFEKIRPLFEQLRRIVDEDVTGLEAFFETVGEGLVLAQKSLDQKSLSYMADAFAYPTVFRIPKVKAEIYFSALEKTGRGFLASIITREESEKKTTHSVSFEVVAAPPPPEVARRVLPELLGGLFVSDLLTRRRIEAALASRLAFLETTSPNSSEHQRTKWIKKDFRRVIIFRGTNGWALVRVCRTGFNTGADAEQKGGCMDAPGQDPNAEILCIQGDLEGKPTFDFSANWPPGDNFPSRATKLLIWMADFAVKQEQYLIQIEAAGAEP